MFKLTLLSEWKALQWTIYQIAFVENRKVKNLFFFFSVFYVRCRFFSLWSGGASWYKKATLQHNNNLAAKYTIFRFYSSWIIGKLGDSAERFSKECRGRGTWETSITVKIPSFRKWARVHQATFGRSFGRERRRHETTLKGQRRCGSLASKVIFSSYWPRVNFMAL